MVLNPIIESTATTVQVLMGLRRHLIAPCHNFLAWQERLGVDGHGTTAQLLGIDVLLQRYTVVVHFATLLKKLLLDAC